MSMAVQDLCDTGTETGTGHVDPLPFILRTASRFIRDLLFTVSLLGNAERRDGGPAKLCHAGTKTRNSSNKSTCHISRPLWRAVFGT